MRSVLLFTLLAAATLSGCLSSETSSDLLTDDAVAAVPLGSHPAYAYATAVDPGLWAQPAMRDLPEPLSGLVDFAHVEGTDTAGGIALFGPYAFLGGRGSGPLHVVDITNPEAPELVASVPDVPVRDADVIAFPPSDDYAKGRLIVITTSGGKNMFATDVTDLDNARMIAQFETEHGNHNIAVVPGTPIVYNSGGGGMIDIVDFSDPENPVQVGTFQNGNGCHDITFFVSETKQRAYCAGYPETEIWDISNPKAPEMIIEIPFPEYMGEQMPLSFSHLALPNHDATVLIVGDETGGGAINACDFYTGAGGVTNSGPYGNLWFYDITDETAPVLHGHVSPSYVDALGGSCTAHFGRVVEDTNHVVMGFYAAGVLLIDFTDLDQPTIVDRLDRPTAPTSSIWDVQYYQGYLFTGDMARGMDVLTFE